MMNPLATDQETNHEAGNNAEANTHGFRPGPPPLNPEHAAVQVVVVESIHIFKHHLGLFLCCSLGVFLCRQALFSGSAILITAIATRDASLTSILSRFSSDDAIRLVINSVSSNVSATSSHSAAEQHGELYMHLFLISLSFCTAICSVAVFLGTYTTILPTAFVAVSQYYVRHLDGRFRQASVTETFSRGCKVGKGRVAKLILWWVLARESVILLLFGCIHRRAFRKDGLRTVRLLIEAMLTPFTFTAPIPMVITNRYEQELGRMWAVWEIPAAVVAYFFVLAPYVVIMDGRRRGDDNAWWVAEGVRGGRRMSSLARYADLKIKVVETVVCGPAGWVVCCYYYGSDFALVFQAVAEVYFVVTYVVVYFVAMFEGGEGLQPGERFGVGDIQRFLNRL